MSFLLSVGQAFFSGLSSIASGITSDITSVANGISTSINSFSNFLQKLPSEIASFFESIPGAIIGFAHTLGTYLWDGLQRIANGLVTVMAPIERGLETIGSTIINALITLWNDLKAFASYIYNTVMSAINGVVSFIQGFINDFKNAIVASYHFLVDVMNDAYRAFTIIGNFFLDLPTFFQNASNFLNSLFTDPGNQPNLLTMVPNLVATEASRVASAFPDVVAYNAFMEVLPKIVSGVANSPFFGNSAKGMFYKALLMAGSPLISAFVSIFTKSLLQSLFSTTQTTQALKRPSQPQLQPPTGLPSSQLQQRSATKPSISDIQTPQTQQLTPTQIEVALERPNVTGAFIQDVIGLGTPGGGTATLVSGYINFQNSIKQFEDAFDVTANFFMKLVQSLQTEFTQDMVVNVSLTLLENIYQMSQTVEILPSVDATAVILPPNISFCNPSKVPSPSESSNATTNEISVTATVDVVEQLCIPPYDLLADTLIEQFGVVSGILSNFSDIIAETLKILSGIPFATSLSDAITLAVQFAFGIPFGTSLTDNVSLTIGFAPIPPSPESYTYYTPVDVPVTYVVKEIGTGSYSGSLSYSVSGS